MTMSHMSTAANASPAPQSFQIRKLSPAIGAELVGLDVSQQLDDATFARILDAWHENCVLLFRDQTLTEEQQVAFAQRFGTLATIHTKQFVSTHPAVMLISNIRKDGQMIGALPDGEMHFHSDQCHQEKPAKGSMLYAIEIPSKGGDTLFANAYLAYETLPDDLKTRLQGLKAENGYDYDSSATKRGGEEKGPSYEHPVVRTHPATGRKALYVNRLMTRRIVGLPAAESEALLTTLFDHQENPEFIYAHVWRISDLLLWDNRCCLHARTDFSAAERRLLRRVTILGEKPV